jgi:hypothetical protein
MIIETEQISFDIPWRFAFVPGDTLDEPAPDTNIQWLEIDGSEVHCMRTFHHEVAADFFFASHYSCDPHAPLSHLEAPVSGEQVVISWPDVNNMVENEPDDWQAVMRMFRAAMATLQPQGTYLRMIFPTSEPTWLHSALNTALGNPMERAGVGFDYATGTDHFELLA